jgi:4-amino-4-deoxy-L-arabinose transferase-like glycosyltransferase
MSRLDITNSFFYRRRYIIGYGLVALGLIAVLLFAGFYLPGGISTAEMQSAIKSSTIDFSDLNTLAITNLPYHLLQKISLDTFGLSIISIKLPSILLSFLSAIGMIILLSRWFKPNISVLASIIAITTGQFLFIAQDGTPGILYLFWAVWLMLLATMAITKTKYRTLIKIGFCILAALSLYTPLGVYILIAMLTSTLIHPHLRYLFRRISRPELIAGFIFSIILAMPLILACFKNSSLALTLLGIPLHLPSFMDNISSLGAQYFGFIEPKSTTMITPVFALGSILIIALGIFYTIKNRSTARSYIILTWLLCLLPFIVFDPSLNIAMFLPLVILLAYGLKFLLSYWYGLFPNNPYARVGGLIPIIVLVTALVFSGTDRYIYSYRYDPSIVPLFSKDITLIPKDTKKLIVASNELPFYTLLEKYNKNITILSSPKSDDNTFLATKEAKKDFASYKIDKIITTPSLKDSDRFYLYKKITD